MEKDNILHIYTDGSAIGSNPGRGGWAAVLVWNGIIKEISGNSRIATNNQMEILAVIEGLKAVKRPVPIIVYSDSKYVIDGITKWIYNWYKTNFKNVANASLWKELGQLRRQHRITFKWVKGHADNEYNNRCDFLARKAAREVI